MATAETFNNLIDGQWRPARSGETFERRNPATGALVATFAKSDAEDVNAAVAAAKRAFETWRLYPAPKRGEILFRAAQMIADRKDEFAREMTEEMGKVLTETKGDVQEAIDMAFYMAGEGRRLYGQTTPSELREKFNMSVRRPIGVCGVITPWNFPMAIPSWKMLPALIAGNTIVFKPATNTPRSAIRFVEILNEAGVPDGVINVVLGTGGAVGDAIVDHPDVPLITFTGSNATGTTVAVAGARRNKRVSLELGGKNAVIVMDDADLDLAVDGIIWSAFGTSGQRCTAASRVVAQRGIHRRLVSRLAERAAALTLGDGLDPTVDVGPVVTEKQLDRIEKYVAIGQREGATLVTGGGRATSGGLGDGFYLRPAIFDNVTPEMRIAREEIFGPVSSVIPVDDLDEAIRVVNGVDYGLSASIFSASVNNAFRAMQDIHTGILYVNAGTIGAEIHLPFGGTKGTGNGHREAGTAALDFVTEWQSIYVDFSGKLQRAQIDLVS